MQRLYRTSCPRRCVAPDAPWTYDQRFRTGGGPAFPTESQVSRISRPAKSVRIGATLPCTRRDQLGSHGMGSAVVLCCHPRPIFGQDNPRGGDPALYAAEK